MTPKEAVTLAKQTISEVFSDETIRDVGLEEVELDDKGVWHVTIGFSRPWDTPETTRGIGLAAVLAQNLNPTPRSYKVVRIHDSTKHVVAVKDRRIEKSSGS